MDLKLVCLGGCLFVLVGIGRRGSAWFRMVVGLCFVERDQAGD